MSSLLEYARHTYYSYSSSTQETVATRTNDAQVTAALHSALASLSIFKGFSVPKLVVVGTQSSGKSSVLNALMGSNILPTGENMTTKTAIQIQLMQVPPDSDTMVDFGAYTDEGTWVCRSSIKLSNPPLAEQEASVRDFIQSEATRLNQAEPSFLRVPVSIRLRSHAVPNMTFVDLPGITMTALTSEGQPSDMCSEIRSLIASYVDERTTILMICPARSDLEADPALELCMKLTSGNKVIGCLTKVDLCDSVSGILRYLDNNVCEELQVQHGYFAVRSKPDHTVSETTAQELAYFRSVPAFRSYKRSDRLGCTNLAMVVHGVVMSDIRACLPRLRQELRTQHDAAKAQYDSSLVVHVPESDADKHGLIKKLLSDVLHQLGLVVTTRTPDASVGRRIKSQLQGLRDALRSHVPFAALQDSQIAAAVQNCEGWSMQSLVPPIEIVEHLIQHDDHSPIPCLLAPCMQYFDTVFQVVTAELTSFVQKKLQSFEILLAWAEQQAAFVLQEIREEFETFVSHLLLVQRTYVYTDDAKFMAAWTSAGQKVAESKDWAVVIRPILSSYFAIVTDLLADIIPKKIIHAVRQYLASLSTHWHLQLQTADVGRLLFQTEEIEELKTHLLGVIRASTDSLNAIDELLAPS